MEPRSSTRCWTTSAMVEPLQRTRQLRQLNPSPFRNAIVVIGLALLLMTTSCVHTPEFRDAHGRVTPGSVATMATVTIGGISQSIWFRGVSQSNPALILLNGGPGISESALFRHYNSALEQHFLVVYWEQRGTGRSFHSNIPPESMTVAQVLHDLDEVVEVVRRRFNQWGSRMGSVLTFQHRPAERAA